jgi:hypothetical protein
MRKFFLLLVASLLAPVAASAPPHPRIWVTRVDLPRVRSLATDRQRNSLGWVPAEECGRILARAQELAEAPPYHYAVDMPGPEGGPSKHWEYTLSDTPPPRHDDYPHYPPWTAMFQERPDSITTRLKHFTFAYLVTGEQRYFEKAYEVVTHLCRWPIIWTDPSYAGGKPCLDTGHAAHAVGLFYDWCYDALPEEGRRLVRTALVQKALEPINEILDQVPDYHNYSAVITMGLGTGALAVLDEEPRAQMWLERCLAKIKRSFDAQGRDGGLLEGPMYGTYFTDSYALLLWGLHTAGVQTDLWQHPFLRTLPRYCLALMAPRVHRLPTFGDGGPTAAVPLTMLLLALRGDTAAAWYLQQIGALKPGSIETLLFLDPARIKPQPPRWNPSACFVDIGYASLRDGFNEDAPFLAFKCGPPVKEVDHNHFDHNSFQLCYRGTWLASDPGYRDYFDPPARKYTTSTLGHNSIVLNLTDEWLASPNYATVGVDQVRLAGGRLDRFYTSSRLDYLRGDATATYNREDERPVQRALREVFFLKPDIFVLRDLLAATQPATFHYLLHTQSDLQVTQDGTITVVGPSAALEVRLFSPQGLVLTQGLYRGAEAYGPYAMASTPRTLQATIVSVLLPRPHYGVVNGGFEAGLLGWTPRRMPGYTENHVLDEQVSHSGRRSARIDAPGGYYYSTHFCAPAGTKLRARFWARLEGAEGGASSCFYFLRGGEAFARADGPAPTGSQWRLYQFEAQAPEGTEEALLALHFFHPQGRAWYDDVEVTLEPAPAQPEAAQIQALARGSAGLVISKQGTRVLLFASDPAGAQLSVAGHRFDFVGEACAASFGPSGQLLAAWLLEGTRLAVDNQPIIRLPRPSTALALPLAGRWNLEAQSALLPPDIQPRRPE